MISEMPIPKISKAQRINVFALAGKSCYLFNQTREELTMARYVWNDRLKQSIRFSYWNELCVIDDNGALVAPVLKLMDLFFRRLSA